MTVRLAYPLDEAAEQLGVSEWTLRREIKDGRIRARRVRGSTRILHDDLVRYLSTRDVLPSDAEAERQARKTAGRGKVVRLVSLDPAPQQHAASGGRGEGR